MSIEVPINIPHVVIIGGGFGGLSAVRALRSSRVHIITVYLEEQQQELDRR